MLLKQATTYLFAHGLSAVLGFLSVVLFTRLLTPAEYGVYVIVLSVGSIYSAIIFTWVRLSILRFESEADADIRVTALASYALSVLTLPILLAVTVYVAGVPFERALAALLLAAALGLFELGQEILRARQMTSAYMTATVFRAVAAIVFSMAFVNAGWGGLGLVFGVVCAYLLGALFRLPAIWQAPRRPFDAAIFRQMAIFGVPMALSGAIFALHAALDRILVAYMLGDAAAGVYGVTADITRQIIAFPALAIGSAVAPVAIRALSEEGPIATRGHLSRGGELLLAIIMPCVVGLAIVAPHLTALVLGPDFRETATQLMPILVFAWLFQVVSQQFVHLSFHLAKKPFLLLLQGCLLLSVNVVAMWLLVPRFGLQGAAMALVIAEAAGVAGGYLLSRAAHPLPFAIGPILKITAAVAVMAGFTALMELVVPDEAALGLVLDVLVGVLSYSAAVYCFDVAGVRSMIAGRWAAWRRPAADLPVADLPVAHAEKAP